MHLPQSIYTPSFIQTDSRDMQGMLMERWEMTVVGWRDTGAVPLKQVYKCNSFGEDRKSTGKSNQHGSMCVNKDSWQPHGTVCPSM